MRLWKAAALAFLLLFTTPPSFAITVSGGTVFISDKEMKEIGQKSAQALEQKYGLLENPQQKARIDKLAKATGASTWHPVKILNTEEVNAFCLPDQWIYVTKGIVERADDKELSFALRHELAHAINNDPEEKVKNSILLQAKLKEAELKGIGAVLGSLLVDLFESSFSRDKERRADAEAVKGMIEEREDPERAISLLEKLKTLRKDKPEKLGKYFASHPPEERRIELIRERIEKAKREGFTLTPPLYAGHPVLVLVTEISKEDQKEKFMEGWTKEAYKALRRENKYEVVGFWDVFLSDEITDKMVIDRSTLFREAKKRGTKFVIIQKILNNRLDIKVRFLSSKERVKASCSVEGSLYDARTGVLISQASENWQFEEDSKKATEHYWQSLNIFLRDLANKLLGSRLPKNFTATRF